jgi:glycosyltransferase involved in cell wall biosynthesis
VPDASRRTAITLRITFLSWRDGGHPDGGGSERYVEEIATRLAQAGHDVTIVCARYPRSAADEWARGVRFRRRGGRLTVYLRGLLFLCSAEGRSQDVVVDVINGLPFAARLVRRTGLIALTHHLHREQWRMIYPGLRGRIGWFIESRVTPRLYRHVRHVTVSESTRADLVSLGVAPELISVIHNGVDRPASSGTTSRSEEPRICVLSRLVPHKQIEHALAALSQLAGEFPDLQLDVIGKGWWSERLRGEVGRLGIDDRVTFHGYLAADERDRVLSEAWLMLAPSVREGWGIAIMEAASCGTPTIAYRDGGGVRESIIDGETGLLASDRADLVTLARRLLTDHALRQEMSQAAAERVFAYSWDTAAKEFETLFVSEEVSESRTERSVGSQDSSSVPQFASRPTM